MRVPGGCVLGAAYTSSVATLSFHCVSRRVLLSAFSVAAPAPPVVFYSSPRRMPRFLTYQGESGSSLKRDVAYVRFAV